MRARRSSAGASRASGADDRLAWASYRRLDVRVCHAPSVGCTLVDYDDVAPRRILSIGCNTPADKKLRTVKNR